ncbi:hypothetical protein C5167_044223 [Papaver somniferum]|uniref:Nudix hydrolase domain-containing protein n=1 Tax=Papaver somniferum TaxID=3469 RepID=A0A4Y7LBU3_PAPSO|nr:nudix hydrolase 8-like [Papaver somniferum]RZC81649.1 hypothetical protein C5167_044223 [Papaver somniferum]
MTILSLNLSASYRYRLTTHERNSNIPARLVNGNSPECLKSTSSYGGRIDSSSYSIGKNFQGRNGKGAKGIGGIAPKILSVATTVSSGSSGLGLLLDAYDDEYGGVIIEPEHLPSNANAFVSILRTSLSNWKLKGKKGVWLKILQEQADLVPIAIKEGFDYHHADRGYIMLTYWIPNDEPCGLPDGPTHQIGVGGFVMNDKKEVLVVQENVCPCQCSGVWKLPTGFINKSEEIFSGVVREVKEETGIDTEFLEVVAFRHVHKVAFEQSDLLFVCMLKPFSFDIRIDEKEIQAAKWMNLDEFLSQSFYEEDHMSKRVIDICVAACEDNYSGFINHHLTSKFDGKLSHLYYNHEMVKKF